MSITVYSVCPYMCKYSATSVYVHASVSTVLPQCTYVRTCASTVLPQCTYVRTCVSTVLPQCMSIHV